MSKVRVFTFAPDWGLPTVGPFALKLLAWLELAAIPYEQVIEANPRKGPKGKNPWIELDGERIGDSEVRTLLEAGANCAGTGGHVSRPHAGSGAAQAGELGNRAPRWAVGPRRPAAYRADRLDGALTRCVRHGTLIWTYPCTGERVSSI